MLASRPSSVLLLMVLACAVVLPAGQTRASNEDPPGTNRDWGVSWIIRAGGAGGGYGDFLQKGTAWDLDFYKQKRAWRYGVGLTFGSLRMKSPYDHEPEWAHFETHGYASRVFRNDTGMRPYLQGRLAIVRMHPRSELFLKKPVEDLDSGESPTDAVNGVGLSLIPGLEVDIAHGLAVDVSAYLNWYLTEKYSLQDYEGNRPLGDVGDPSDGIEWGMRVGATWRPLSHEYPKHASASPDTSPLPAASSTRDAWGATRSFGWAAGEVLMINFGASMFNEYVRQANFNQISPRSFWANMEEGFTYDDNKFKTNQVIHPFNGSTYYNSSRANGLSFWPSTVYAIAGAFIWEAMGETHPMSWNDMIATGIGGIAFGETTYRLSSAVHDNTSAGSGRTWREVGGFLINPVRGFNRFVSGRASRVQGNPSSPYDWRPPVPGRKKPKARRATAQWVARRLAAAFLAGGRFAVCAGARGAGGGALRGSLDEARWWTVAGPDHFEPSRRRARVEDLDQAHAATAERFAVAGGHGPRGVGHAGAGKLDGHRIDDGALGAQAAGDLAEPQLRAAVGHALGAARGQGQGLGLGISGVGGANAGVDGHDGQGEKDEHSKEPPPVHRCFSQKLLDQESRFSPSVLKQRACRDTRR